MNKIKKEFIGKRVVGAPESAMRVLSMWLMKKSIKSNISEYKYERLMCQSTKNTTTTCTNG